MRMVHIRLAAMKQSRWYEHIIRFGLGGLATVVAGAIAKLAGPSWGGLFLAFPAIFCASSTLIETHERRRKQAKHLQGMQRGQQAAALDAFGAALGSAGMAGFALTVWAAARLPAFIALALAMTAWAVIAVTAWHLGKETHLRVVRRRADI